MLRHGGCTNLRLISKQNFGKNALSMVKTPFRQKQRKTKEIQKRK
jgi:hypothetical protein